MPDSKTRPAASSASSSAARYALFFAIYLIAIGIRFIKPGDLYLSYFTDDFFYYYKIAENLSTKGISSFDGIHLTNGYHPLWMLIIAAIHHATGGMLNTLLATSFVICVLVTGTYVTYDKISRLVIGEMPAAVVGATMAAIFVGVLARTGMEISLAALFIALFFYRCLKHPIDTQTPAALMLTGLIASLTCLARIDAIIPILAYLMLCLPKGHATRARWSAGAYLAIGAFLLPLYAAINWVEFGSILPISGQAKQLKPLLPMSGAPLVRLMDVNPINLFFTWPTIALATGALFKFKSPNLPHRARLTMIALALHPVIFYSLLVFSSDWPSWTWYLYPIPPLACLAIPVVLRGAFSGVKYLAPLTIGAFAAVAFAGIIKVNPASKAILDGAKEIQAFSITHPGNYGMGDRAGTVGYLLSTPLIQTEGLVGDKRLLASIKQGRNLIPVLQELNVDYYVASNAALEDGCHVAREPAQAGPTSPVMIGKFCFAPVYHFAYGGFDTLIFRVPPAPHP
jgi:hypothetical protein